ncbi:MAG: response regulator [Verrucomicrobiota bacterium]
MRILAVEDDYISLKLIEATLTNFGHEVVLAQDGVEAWEKFQNEWFPVVVSDWMMPDLDGLELCSRIRKSASIDHKYTYFVLVTARTGKDHYLKAMEMGVDDFLTKPLNQEDLYIRLRVAQRILSFTKEIHQLKELIPICMYCKKVRNDQNYWEQIDAYLHAEVGTDFSHSICPECMAKIQAEREKNKS